MRWFEINLYDKLIFFVQCVLDTRRFLFVFCFGREGDMLLSVIVIGLRRVCGHCK